MDRLLRRTLGSREPPSLPPSFERRVLIEARDQHAHRLTKRGRRWMLAYIAATALASALIILRIDWPALPPNAVVFLAPLSFAATLAVPELARRLMDQG
jgi:hypothetical protein